jgi:hypothetical protein
MPELRWLRGEASFPAPAAPVKDRGKSYRRQVWETIIVALAFGLGILMGHLMQGTH